MTSSTRVEKARRREGEKETVAPRLREERAVTIQDVTAIFTFNDQMATGAVGALQRVGRRVPEAT